MTDNEKAAIAAGLWGADWRKDWREPPDMHDPANLWRALENMDGFQWAKWLGPNKTNDVRLWRESGVEARGRTLFAALVALYDAEHPSKD